ncbi:hypothetical protein FEM48_Zijuj01G0308600 [Ziziphus jujuba var. spinosa]|uniref:AB hydrolase-1 domain-containing protein n=1 Tax=Ziziphus jujuba var. spinosa TaxID=714518 RepID=A0A978W640_ZIZJJ|nr:hypothetical protein FEM48_Zijuj01G0308600 [Ziziphus jujuba var. spinosa]
MALAWAPLLPRPLSHQPSSPISTKSNKTCLSLSWNTSISTGCTKYRASTAVITKATADDKDQDSDSDQPAFNPFGFVTNNPSSRSAIQLPESPAEDGNVGQMLYRIEDKGREYGSYVISGKFRWFVRETGSAKSRRGTIVFLHGAPTQSYSYRNVMSELSELGFHCFAPDWIGFGFSDKPQPGYGFDYTEKEFHEELDRLLAVLGIESPFYLVVQGFLVGSYGLTWALKNPSRISKIAILNSPVTVSSPTPGLFQKLRIPLYGEFTSQNAIIAERFIEAGSPKKFKLGVVLDHAILDHSFGKKTTCSVGYPLDFTYYVLKLEKADVYRLPYLSSSGPGFALLEAARKANFSNISSQIAAGFASGRWDKPVLLAWGISDKYLPQSVAEEFQKGNPDNVKLKLIEGAGHMPQEDWPEKVVEALCVFF